MPRLAFRNFSDLGFVQQIDKPRYLRPLLEPFSEYFARQGIDISMLTNDDGSDRKLLEVFTQPDEGMPPELLNTLYVLDDLADETGHDRILSDLERWEVDLDVEPARDDLTPGEFAIAVYLCEPGIIQICHEKTIYRKIRTYQEYQCADEREDLALADARRKARDLERAMSPWFEAHNRSRACEIYAYEEGDERAGTVRKKGWAKPKRMQASYFPIIRKAIEAKSYFDPTTWRLFKPEIADKHSVYRFHPAHALSFALVFLAAG